MDVELGLSLRERRKLRVLERGLLRRIIGPKRKVAGWR
jgi:hypothetical protein